MVIPLLDSAKMRELDRITIEEIGLPGPVLMEVAGRGCAEAVEEKIEGGPATIAVVCGKGNNGGDGLVAARHLHHAGHFVDVFLLAEPEKLQGDALLNYQILKRIGFDIEVIDSKDAASEMDLEEYDVIVDAIFGTGLSSQVRGLMAAAIERINESGVPVMAIDLPSGISAETGAVMGVAIQAVHTTTFAYPKPGHVVYPGAAHTGELTVVDIGIPPTLLDEDTHATWLLTKGDIVPYLQRRAPGSHKGDFGHLVVVAGSPEKPGAAGLCCRSAVRTGAGLVTLAGSDDVLRRVVTGPVEFMGARIESIDDLLAFCQDKSAVAIGPGLGTSKEAAGWVARVVSELAVPVVVDADGLNNLAGNLGLLDKAKGPRILTPHPGEMARLMDCTVAEVQNDRLGAARQIASKHGCVTVLKGAGTIVAKPDGAAFVVPLGNPGMASGGTGDVLTGVIGGLLAQRLSPSEAASVGAFVHALAGDVAVQELGQHALSAGDLVDALAPVLKKFEDGQDADETEPA